jgi:uncharacterized sulfatase
MEGRALLETDFPERPAVFAARDRCGDAMDRLRAVITQDHLLVRNFDPGLSYLNWSSYKEEQYPGLPLLRVLHAQGRLDHAHAFRLSSARPGTELYDLRADPTGVHLSQDESTRAELESGLEAWIKSSRDQGLRGDPATEPALQDIQKSKRVNYRRVWEKRLGKPEPTDAERLGWWEKSYGLPAEKIIP